MTNILQKSKFTFVHFFSCGPFYKAGRFFKDNNGATAIEYGLLAAILAVGIIAGADGMGNIITNMWTDIATDVGAS